MSPSKVLIADDEPEIREAFAQLFKMAGWDPNK